MSCIDCWMAVLRPQQRRGSVADRARGPNYRHQHGVRSTNTLGRAWQRQWPCGLACPITRLRAGVAAYALLPPRARAGAGAGGCHWHAGVCGRRRCVAHECAARLWPAAALTAWERRHHSTVAVCAGAHAVCVCCAAGRPRARRDSAAARQPHCVRAHAPLLVLSPPPSQLPSVLTARQPLLRLGGWLHSRMGLVGEEVHGHCPASGRRRLAGPQRRHHGAPRCSHRAGAAWLISAIFSACNIAPRPASWSAARWIRRCACGGLT